MRFFRPSAYLAKMIQTTSGHGKIDIVYLWVDGADVGWRAKRQLARDRQSGRDLAVFANVEGRFRDNQELRYSLRSLEQFFPDHGHIFIVTDAQTPSWLVPSDGLTIVDHRDLIPEENLPTFDSGNIESYIHKIPGLSERYFYLNDDIFFGAPVDQNDWFTDDGVFLAWSKGQGVDGLSLDASSTALHNACRCSLAWMQHDNFAAGDWQTMRTFAHSPRPMLRSVVQALELAHPERFDSVRHTVFRRWDAPPIVSDYLLRICLANGVGKTRSYTQAYVSTGAPDVARELSRIAKCFGSLDFFCINDTTDDASAEDARLNKASELLARVLPNPSRFERIGKRDNVGVDCLVLRNSQDQFADIAVSD
jgi:Stealth protein CR2, conserved region 2/Stealth protein CR1, conserved region 1/Stealth protein CR4, conserved region 4